LGLQISSTSRHCEEKVPLIVAISNKHHVTS
jgi:hypothetical protein